MFYYNSISYSHCTRIWFGSFYHCFNTTKAKIHIELIPTVERYVSTSTKKCVYKDSNINEFYYFSFLFIEENIGNSRDSSFEKLIMRNTKGRGVDFVLNSLSEDKLLASVRCMARGGIFLEIGKFDIMNNSSLGMNVFEKEITFRAVFADNLISMPMERRIIHELIDKDIRTGIIQPLHSTVFHVNEIEQAYRFMSTGKHVGKVMIQIRDAEHSLASVPIKVNAKVYCKSDFVYVVAGGLGGFGLELCDWLVVRGARFLVINSRRGVSTTYQAYRIR